MGFTDFEMSDSEFIKIKNLIVGWNQNRPVCSISELNLKKQSISVLCGPNGAGKSTLLKTIAGQLSMLAGQIEINGKRQEELSRSELAKLLAFVPQFLDTKRSLSVEEWVALGRNPHQKWWSWQASSLDRQKIAEALKRTECSLLKDKLMDALSGGERQRALIAMALAQEPLFMLLDEPTAHLDFRHQLELLDLLKQLKKEGLGILIVLHDLNLASRIADEVVLLKTCKSGASEIAAQGPVEQVLNSEILKEVYEVEMEIVKTGQGFAGYFARSLSNADSL